MLASLVTALSLQFIFGMDTTDVNVFAQVMLITVSVSSVAWISVTFLTKPENDETLLKFYRKIRPGGSLWKPMAELAPEVETDKGLLWDLADWAVGITLIYSTLFGFGKILLGSVGLGFGLLLISASCFYFLQWDLKRRGWKTLKN